MEREVSHYQELFFEELDSGGETPWTRAFERYFERRGLELNPDAAASRYLELELAAVRPADPSQRSTLEQLSENLPVGVLTRGVGRVQRAKIEKLQLSDVLDDIAISHELGARKSDGSLFEAARQRLSADEYVYVSTHESDVEHARQAGWKGRLVDSFAEEEILAIDYVRQAIQ
jgi:putative hydrolase of the HAD superfamily